MHQKNLHDWMRSLMSLYVKRCFSASERAYANPSAGFRMILNVRIAGFSGRTVLTILTVLTLNDANSSMNVTQTHRRSSSIALAMIFLLRKTASCNVVEAKISFK